MGGLKAFSLSRDKRVEIEEFIKYETIEELASACWTGQSYFQMWMNDENINSTPPLIEIKSLKEFNDYNFNKLPNGVYYLEYNGNESHLWMWIINDNELIYGGTYGGICEQISLMTHSKQEYLKRFKLAMDGSLEDYMFVFDIETPSIKNIKFGWLQIHKSPHFG